ncbi:hypothetical protein DEI97_002305 [Curtobacterium sp. MCLR17_032]|uniref:hypothetical protein n=1 Tax=Curtobacterium sp. MCLR17_032 TaxID=2175650 RepID=UPI000DA7F552|nr:hypothetical protein [Curtobacterium sp. MCLR17_032]WIE61990.1 hypothetical protein DEI97_002305 [Curtobacterium sp. MCLR17_032]
MIGLGALVVMITVALLTIRHLWIAAGAIIAVLVLIPQVAAPVIGIPVVGSLNLGTVFIGVVASAQFATRTRTYLQDALDALPTTLAILTLGTAVVLTSSATGTSGEQQFLIDSLAPSAAGFALVRRAISDAPRAGTRLAQIFVAVVVVECIVALLIWSGALPQPFAAEYAARYYWFDINDQSRALGTADSFLELAVVVLVAVALLRSIRRAAIIAPCAMLFIATLFATQARAALALSVVALVAMLVARRVPFVPAATIALLSFALTIATLLALPELGAGLSEKLRDDDGSSRARSIALTEGLPELTRYVLLGGGPENAVTTAVHLRLGTSFENPALMLGLCWGVLASGCYFGVLTGSLLAPGVRPRAVEGGRLAGALALVAVMTFSSVAFVTGLGTLLWMTVAMGAPPFARRDPEGERPGVRRQHRAASAPSRSRSTVP